MFSLPLLWKNLSLYTVNISKTKMAYVSKHDLFHRLFFFFFKKRGNSGKGKLPAAKMQAGLFLHLAITIHLLHIVLFKRINSLSLYLIDFHRPV